MGLLGSDKHQDELTDKLFGDLKLRGKLCKIADNIYFGDDTLTGFQEIFEEIMARCDLADVRLKPTKLMLNVVSAEVLGLNWTQGRLAPTPHKLDPLAHCEKPKSVKALRSYLGGVRFLEICLKGPQLAEATQLLDHEIPSSRSGRERIVWTPQLLQAFLRTQEILKDPVQVTIPKKGDVIWLANDACTNIPACGLKMIIQRPGIDGYLPSFNWGSRLPDRVKSWEPCEVEAYSIHHGIKHLEYWIKLTENPGVVLVDSKAVYQATKKLEKGEISASRRIQDLLVNISNKKMSVQLYNLSKHGTRNTNNIFWSCNYHIRARALMFNSGMEGHTTN
jgi:hypothetical protein